MRQSARAAILVALVGLVPAGAFAQGAGPQAPAAADTGSPPPASSGSPTPATSAPAPPAAGAPAPEAPARPVVAATGYGWSPKPAKHPRGKVRARKDASAPSPAPPETPATGTVVPGFETLADGTSRVFVQMPRAVTYSAKAAKGALVYVLKGLRIDRRNNLNALVTVHFNTPVTSARLVPHGSDLWLVVDLRANVQPTVAMDTTKDGAVLRLEFPRGDYLGGGPSR